MTLLLELLTEVSFEQLEDQFVKSGKITPEDFEEIKQATNKSSYATWLAKKVAEKMIKGEDIYKWKEYLEIFNRNKRSFASPDINAVKTKEGVLNFARTAISLRDKEQADPAARKGMSKVDKFADLEIGEVDGFTVYEIPKGRTDLYNTSCELGSGTEWCTATGNTDRLFIDYINQGPLFIFINPKTGEKYQFHYESNQFMDSNDEPII